MRLIDADVFTEQIAAATIKATLEKVNGNIASLGTNIIKLVDAQPTVYDVDNVIEKLKHLSFKQPEEYVGIGEHNRVVTKDGMIVNILYKIAL